MCLSFYSVAVERAKTLLNGPFFCFYFLNKQDEKHWTKRFLWDLVVCQKREKMEHDRAYLSRDQYQQDDGEETFPISQDMILNAWAENETNPSTADKGLQYSSQRYHEQEQVGRQSARGPRFPGAAEQNRQSSGVPISSSHSETTVHSSPQRLEKSEDKESERPQPSSSPSRKRQVVNAPNNVQNQQNNLLPSVDSSLELSSPNWGSLMDSLQKTIQEEFDLHSQENRRRHQQTVADLQDQYQNELSKWRDHALKLQDENESLQAEKQQWMRISERLATTRGLMKLKNVSPHMYKYRCLVSNAHLKHWSTGTMVWPSRCFGNLPELGMVEE